ncbi:MAG: class I SAM-dependent methyltransferase [Desulfosarcina sp.]|nr:class I SAM-dependent methyltransferase [Desulfosarcina sp.]
MESNYRTRIYGAYVSASKHSHAPATLDDLNPRLPYLQKLIRWHFPRDRNAAILDLGCGHGTLIHLARQAGYRNLRGVDRSPEQVAAAKNLCVEGVEQGDVMEALAKESVASLDCLITFDLIEHFNRNELISLVDAAHRVLRRRGSWIIHTTNAESPFCMRIRYGDLTHELAFTRASLSQLLLSSGFSKMDCYEDQPIPHGTKSTIRWALWKVVRSFLRLYLAIETGDTGRDTIFSQNFLAVAIK